MKVIFGVDKMIPANQILIRPPVEASSVLIPVTGGCSWNLCRFCGIYKGVQKYAIRPLKDVIYDIRSAAKYYSTAPHIYLAGGNPTSAPTEYLVAIIKEVKRNFPQATRISCYAKILDIIKKTDEELKEIAQAGLSIVYMGMESGSNIVLKYMKKGNTQRTLIESSKRLMKAGIDVSLYIILGLGGKKWTEEHAKETAHALNQINPTIFRFRTLNVMENSPLKKDIDEKIFQILTPLEVLKEERMIINNLNGNLTSAFYNDHVSNYIYINSENVGKDKEFLIKELDKLINDPEVSKWEHKGLKTM